MNPFVIFVLCIASSLDPEYFVRGVYINPYQASERDYLENIYALADSGLINTVVVDFKSDYGFLCYNSKIQLAKDLGAIKRFIDVKALIENCEAHNLKLVARVVCFRDNYLTQYKDYAILNDSGEIWCDNKGLAWANPYRKGVTDYLVDIADELCKLGIKSFAFDYIRFPTDGEVKRMALSTFPRPRSKPIINFLKEVKSKINAEIGTCIFGYSVWYDLKSEGQDVKKFGEYVDVIYPMLYPSHFNPAFKIQVSEYWRNFWIYFDSVKEAFKKLPPQVKVVPFVQGFDLYAQTYGASYITSQINGTIAAGSDGFVIWNASGNYTTSWLPLCRARNLILKRSAPKNLDNHRTEEVRRYQGKDLR